MARFKDSHWNLPVDSRGRLESWDHARLAVLMDIRDELKTINQALRCFRIQRMFTAINNIEKKLPKRRKRRRKK